MNKKISLFGIAIVAIANCFGQMKEPGAEDKVAAERLKKVYKDQDFLIVESTTQYKFELSSAPTDTVPLRVIQKSKESLVCLNEKGTSYGNAVLYDDNSSIKALKVFDNKGKLNTSGAIISRKTHEENGIFYSDAKIFSYVVPFYGLGAKASLELEKEYTDVKYLTAIYFHSHYPTSKRTIEFSVPEWMEVELKEMNMEGYVLDKTSSPDVKNKTTLYTYTLVDLKADKSERNSPGSSYILPHILILCKGYNRNGVSQSLFRSTQDLYHWYSGLVKTIGNDPTVLNALVSKLTSGKTTDEEKIESLFYWVQDNIRYIAFEDGIAGFRPASCQKVYDSKYGDCKGMANLLKQMLIIAGYDARLTWLGTRHIAYNYRLPSIAVDNHMICTVFLKGKKYFLDPTETYIPFGEIAYRIQGREVIIEDGEKFILEKTPEYGKESNLVQSTIALSVQGDKLVGKKRDLYNGESKLEILRAYGDTKSDKKEELLKSFIQRNDNSISVQNLKMSDMSQRKGTLQFDYDIILNYKIQDIGDEKYINLDYSHEWMMAEFDSNRTKDYMLDYKYSLVKEIELEIPEGYNVKYLPENVNVKSPEFTFAINYKSEGKKIYYSKEISVDNAVIPKEKFKEWNQSIGKLKSVYEDQIILSK